MPDHKQKKLYYYTAEIQGLSALQANLEVLLENELQNSPNAIDTRFEYSKGCFRLVGHRYIPNKSHQIVAIRLMSYEAGNKAQAFDRALNSPNVQTQAVMPPNANSEFLEGIAFLFVNNNNIIISFSASFRESAIQDYLNWFLFQRNNTKGILLLNRGIARSVKGNIADIKDFEFFAMPDFSKRNQVAIPTGLNDQIIKGATNSQNSLSVNSLIDERAITMYTGYRINQRMASNQNVFDDFINKILRNIDPSLDWKIVTKDKVLTRDDITLTKSITVLSQNSIIDDSDMYRKMYDWYLWLKKQKYI